MKITRSIFFLSMIIFLLCPSECKRLNAAEENGKGLMTLPGEPCRVEPINSWTEQEKMTWELVCEGEIIDFGYIQSTLDATIPKEIKNWPDFRVLSSTFLETILLHEPYRSAITRHGVRIRGAWFKEKIDLSKATIHYPIEMVNCQFDSMVDLSMLQSLSYIALQGCKFKEKLNMHSLKITNHLFMAEGAMFEKDVDLNSARIGGQLSMKGSIFKGNLVMDNIDIKSTLFMNNAIFGVENGDDENKVSMVSLNSAKISGTLAMEGSIFKGNLHMDKLEVESSLYMREKAEFYKEVILRSAKVGGQLDMKSSIFKGKLNMNSIKVSNHLFMREGANFEQDVDLRHAKIGGSLDLSASKFTGNLNMKSLEVSSGLFMRKAEFEKEVDLNSARIDGSLEISGSKFKDKLIMDSLEISSKLHMDGGSRFEKRVDLIGTKIGGNLKISASKFKGKLTMDTIEVTNNLFMREGAEFEEQVDLTFAKIGGGLNIYQGTFSSFNITGSRINKEFFLGSEKYPPPKWNPGAKLTLRNTYVGTLQDTQDSWPDELELVGFTYSNLGGFGASAKDNMASRNTEWMIKKWLNKQNGYSPQPYEQLASVLNKAGFKDKAIDILVASKNEERKVSPWSKKLLLLFLKYTIRYGYDNLRIGFWFLGFLIIGSFIIWRNQRKTQSPISNAISIKAQSPVWCLIFSLDMLLPIIELDKKNYQLALIGCTKYYFQFHKIAGYILVTMLIAGILGLTK